MFHVLSLMLSGLICSWNTIITFDANWEVDLKCIVLYNYNCEVKAHLAAVNIYNVLFLNINGCVYIIL